MTRGLDFGRFDASGWGSPRDRGFEYNWARSGATTGDLIATGQHTGLAAQVARGDVGTVFVFIGGNDFIDAMYEPDPEAALREALPRALANYRLAIGTIRAADPDVRLVLATVPDIRLLPEFAGPFREGRLPARLADACTAAMGRYNAQIRAMAAGDRRVALIDLDLVARLADLVSRDYAVVAGRRLDRPRPGNSPDRFFLADRRHPGTLAQAELARLFILAVNARFGAGIEPLGDAEILRLVDDPPAGRAGRRLRGREDAAPSPIRRSPGRRIAPGSASVRRVCHSDGHPERAASGARRRLRRGSEPGPRGEPGPSPTRRRSTSPSTAPASCGCWAGSSPTWTPWPVSRRSPRRSPRLKTPRPDVSGTGSNWRSRSRCRSG